MESEGFSVLLVVFAQHDLAGCANYVYDDQASNTCHTASLKRLLRASIERGCQDKATSSSDQPLRLPATASG
jgi:hypothetical protein